MHFMPLNRTLKGFILYSIHFTTLKKKRKQVVLMFLHPHSSKPASRSSLPATRPQSPFSDFHAAPLLQVHWLSRGYRRCSGLSSTPTCARLHARPRMDGDKRMSASHLERDADCKQASFRDSVGRAEIGWLGC